MSAGFKVADEVFWGTNGAVETYIAALAAQSASQLGLDHPLTAFFSDERDGFSMGRIVFLDEWIAENDGRQHILKLLDAATEQLLREEAFSDYGQEWVATTVSALRTRIAGMGLTM